MALKGDGVLSTLKGVSTTFNELKLSEVKDIIKNGSEETTKVTEDTTSSKSSNSSGSKKKS